MEDLGLALLDGFLGGDLVPGGFEEAAVTAATAIAEDTSLNMVVRQRVGVMAAMALVSAGRRADAAAKRELAMRLRPTRRDFRRHDETKSGITMAGGERLTAANILGMRVEANLVTLSACQSGINAQRPGNELIGLTRSLIYAGAATMLGSLWAVGPRLLGVRRSVVVTVWSAGPAGGAGRRRRRGVRSV